VKRGAARSGRVGTGAAILALLVVATAPGAWAAPPAAASSRMVLVARPDDADAVTAEALARVSGELVAAGFDVLTVHVPANADPRTTVETAGRDQAVAAAFAIFPGAPAADGTPSAEIWVSNRLTGRSTVERLSVDPRDSDRRAAVLAVRAVELLNASVAELWVRGAAPSRKNPPLPPSAAPPVPMTTAVATPAPAASHPSGVSPGVVAAVAVVGHVGGFPVDVGPLLRLCLALDRRFTVRVSAFGLDRGWGLVTDDGSADVRQQVATADLVLAFRSERRLRPLVTAGLGASRVAWTSSGNTPWLSQPGATWTASGGVGAGGTLALGRWLSLIAEVDAQFFLHRPVIQVGGPIAGRAGQPAILGTLGLLVSL